ncbi:MAG: preprotein translocase subunit SecG [Lachnospira sp.]|nr:preprotein translocase subunit SecG [Lachnospira sp.]
MFGMSWADTIRIALMIVFVIVAILLTVLVLMQEGKQNGLGAIAGGSSDTYWGKNKGRTMEGKLATYTKILVAVFIIIAAVLNMNF